MKDKRNEKLFGYIRFAIFLTLVLLAIGILGFYIFDRTGWIGAIYETTAIMSAVGAANSPTTDEAKIFASFFTMAIGLGYIFFISFIISYLTSNNILS